MNLVENYKKLFGDFIKEDKLGHRIQPTKQILSESHQKRFNVIQKEYQKQYPSKQLRLKEGFVCVDNLVVERAETFLDKNNNQIIQLLKSYSK